MCQINLQITIERCDCMGFTFDFDKFKKHDPRDYSDYMDDEFDYEYAEEFIFEDEYGDVDRYDM